jgi:protein-tyrosine-phosphatase
LRGPNGEDLPGAILFACNMNAVRSPMAAALMRHLYGRWVFVESIGVRQGELDPFAVSVMEEIGIDISDHNPKPFEELLDTSFDIMVTLTPQAHHKALDITSNDAVEVEYWPTADPTAAIGSRDQIMEAYRQVRDELQRHIEVRFLAGPAPNA